MPFQVVQLNGVNVDQSGNIPTTIYGVDITQSGNLPVELPGLYPDQDGNMPISIESSNSSIDVDLGSLAYGQNGGIKTIEENSVETSRFSSRTINYDYIKTITGIGSYTTNSLHSLSISTGAQANSGVDFQTHSNFSSYVPTGIISRYSILHPDGSVTGNTQTFGFYNDDSGIFIQVKDGAYSFVLRVGGIDTVIPATAWQVPVTPDDKWHMWELRTQYYGVGVYQIFRDRVLLYTLDTAGIAGDPSTGVPELPLKFSNKNTTNVTDIDMIVLYAGVSVESEEALTLFNQTVIWSKKYNIGNKRGNNSFIVNPFFINENNNVLTGVVDILDGTTTDIIQVFRCKQDNIHAVGGIFDIEFPSSETQVIDCDSLTGWTDNSSKIALTSDTTIKTEGTASVKVSLTHKSSVGDSAYYTWGSDQDWIDVNSIKFDYRQSRITPDTTIRFHIEDSSGNSKWKDLLVAAANTWQTKNLLMADFTEDQVTETDMTAITVLRFEVLLYGSATDFWIDDIRISEISEFGDFDFELYNLGTNPVPTSLGTSIASLTVPINALGLSIYSADFGNIDITPDNYYALVATNPTISGIEISWYGNTLAQSYTSGKCYYSNNDGTSLTEIANKTPIFAVYSREECDLHIIKLECETQNQSQVQIFISEVDTNNLYELLVHNYQLTNNDIDIEYNLSEHNNLIRLHKDLSISIYFGDDGTIDNTFITVELDVHKKQMDIWG